MRLPGSKPRPWEWMVLSALALAMVLFAAFKSSDALRGDEGRYLAYAQNLLRGGYASPETLFLWNAPGFPLIVAAALALHLPLFAVKILNAFFLFGAVWQFRALLLDLGLEKRATFYALALGIFLLAHGSLAELLMSEPLSVFLCMGAARYGNALLERGGWNQAIAAGACLGGLALTKGFFGYVLAACIALAGMAWIFSRSKTALRALVLGGIGMAAASPYLAYTQKLTGRFFYWGNSGGTQLYCMTLPEPRFLGDWFNSDAVKENPDFFGPHAELYRRAESLDFVARDSAFKAAAWRNIREHPGKFVRNWRANVNRMVFGYPVSAYPGSDPELATGNRAFVYALPFILALFTLPAFAAWRVVPPGLWAVMVFFGVSLAGLSLLSAVPRQAFPLLPLLWVWIVYAGEKLLGIRFRPSGADED